MKLRKSPQTALVLAGARERLGDAIPVNHQETEYLSITHSHVPSFWRRATSVVTVPLRLRVEVRARSPLTVKTNRGRVAAGYKHAVVAISAATFRGDLIALNRKHTSGLDLTTELDTPLRGQLGRLTRRV